MLGKSGADTQNETNGGGSVRGAAMSGSGDEFALIDALASRFAVGSGELEPGDLGIGDDAAAVTLPARGRVMMGG